MGKRSDFPHHEQHFYVTPLDAVVPLLPFLRGVRTFAEPCCCDGALVNHLTSFGLQCVYAGDIATGQDALAIESFGDTSGHHESTLRHRQPPQADARVDHAFHARCAVRVAAASFGLGRDRAGSEADAPLHRPRDHAAGGMDQRLEGRRQRQPRLVLHPVGCGTGARQPLPAPAMRRDLSAEAIGLTVLLGCLSATRTSRADSRDIAVTTKPRWTGCSGICSEDRRRPMGMDILAMSGKDFGSMGAKGWDDIASYCQRHRAGRLRGVQVLAQQRLRRPRRCGGHRPGGRPASRDRQRTGGHVCRARVSAGAGAGVRPLRG